MKGLYRALSRAIKQSILLERSRNYVRRPTHTCSANPERVEPNSHFFGYTRYVRLNIPALQQIAGQIAGSQCIEMTKMPEGLFNKVFSLKMENGREILARIPNPNAGDPRLVVASEVATLDFLRTVLDVPVPTVLAWSSTRSLTRVNGRQLSEVWDAMSEAERFGLVKSLVEIERKLVNVKFQHHGSLSVVKPTGSEKQFTSDFVIGPTTQRSPWEDGTGQLDIDRGPFLPQILPPQETLCPVLQHHDLHVDNIFVDSSDIAKISSIIDWQAIYTAPLFMQAKFPSIFDCDDPYPWGAVQPSLPKDFDTLSQPEKGMAEDTLTRLRLKKFYELASRKFNRPLVTAMDAMRNDDDPTAFIFHIVGQTSEDGPLPLKELLLQIFSTWDQIMQRRGVTTPCPISFSRDEIDQTGKQVEKWADAYGECESLRANIAGKDGWASHEEYDEAMSRWSDNRAKLELLQGRLGKNL
ncbi:kinase-like domain-containing protein [Aspergillus karnatakaensis]|uniref:phosphotransferase family protein n=1 Tax=Aspergillus karnatakaensis TaxID=1810916 RepID=UPI003CCD8CD2